MKVFFFDSNEAMVHLLSSGFRDIGHEVLVSGDNSLEAFETILDRFQPQLVITNGWAQEQTVENQIRLKNYVKENNIPHVYWSVEDPCYTDSFALPLIQRVEPDFVFTICSSKVDFYKSLGIKVAHLDWGYQPTIHYPYPSEEFAFDIALVANSYAWAFDQWNIDFRIQSMKQLLCPLIEENIRVDIFGKGWENIEPFIGKKINPDWLHGTLPYIDCRKVYSSSKIIIGLQNFTGQVTQRTYETLAAGGFLLTSDTPAVRQLFQPNRDLVVSSDPQETIRLVKYYLQNERKRKEISQNGHIAVQPHSYKNRVTFMLRTLLEANILQSIE